VRKSTPILEEKDATIEKGNEKENEERNKQKNLA
jgi:hypothetical protein